MTRAFAITVTIAATATLAAAGLALFGPAGHGAHAVSTGSTKGACK
ncbi:hypothetical protein [Nocardia brasiliensis]|nr:hypothetical protein [Nocardia brasiliensis]